MVGVAALVDRAVDLPPGAELAAVLDALSGAAVPNARRVEVLQARARLLAHDQARVFAELVELSHAVALADVEGERDEVVARAAKRFEWAAHEIAAGLTWTPTAADRELGFATALVERLPLVQEALLQGRIDRGKARVFTEYLDPADGDVNEAQARRLCEQFVPLAPGLTTKQLSDRLHRALQAIDPQLRRRRYERAVQARGVALYLDPRTGTATLVGNGLPPDEAAAAATRLDRLAEAAKRAGHPGTRPQISADLYLSMLNGCFHGLSEQQIIDRLLATHRPEDDRDAEPVGPETGPSRDTDQGAGDGIATREGIEVRIGLATLAGLDDRPGEIPGLGPIGAAVARTAVAAQRRGAAWKFAIVDANGYLLLAGPLRRRPRTTGTRPPVVRGGVVELHVTLEELQRHGTEPDLGVWAGVLAEIADAWADRDRFRRRLAAHPKARFARGALADHIRIRDRNCCGPGCTRPARNSDLDHTREHHRGGETVEVNIGPACKSHHPDKDRGWTLAQPEPGVFVWISPLGRTYRTRGEPIRPDLPDPDPTSDVDEESAAELDRRLRRHEPRILERPATDSPRPPPPHPDRLYGEPPPF
jgi:Domain of unknown function (DUF222)